MSRSCVRFEAYHFHDERPAGEQAGLLLEFIELYRRKKLVRDNRVDPLCEICPHADKCWSDAKKGEKRCPAMWRHCPAFLLADELDILRPDAVLVLGSGDNRTAIRGLNGFVPNPGRGRFPEGSIAGDGWSARVFVLPHPRRSKDLEAGEHALRRWLRAHPRQ